MMTGFLHDLRFGIRMLVKAPALTLVAALSLALGIGANTTVFCWIQRVLLHPLPGVAKGEEMVVLTSTHGSAMWDTVSLPDLRDLGGLKDVFAGVIGSQLTPACINLGGKPQWLYGQIATANFFEVLGVKPILGRTFLAEEDLKPGGSPVLVLSESCWQGRFGGDSNVVGQTVELNRQSFTVVGVVPAQFQGTMSGLQMDFWAPLSMHKQVANFGSMTERGDRWLHTQARLQSHVDRAKAQAAVNTLMRQLGETYPNVNRDIGVRVLPLWKSPYGGQGRFLPVLSILMVVSIGVLLIVAANVANLLLARATVREKEMAIRLAMGAGRLRLIRQLLIESILLALLGAAGGVLVAYWAADMLLMLIPPTHLPIGYHFNVDARTLSVSLVLGVATALLFGLAPAIQCARYALNETLKEGGRTSSASVPHHRLRAALVASEIALALLLLVSAGLCSKGFERARRLDIGFDPRNTLVAGLRVGMHGYTEEKAMVFYRLLRARLSEVPGVESVGLASWFPLGFEGGPGMGLDVDGYSKQPSEDTSVSYSIVSPGYFQSLRIPILDGRDFTEQDDVKTPCVAIINETMAKRFWAGQNPIGRKLRFWGGHKEATVVGIVKAGKYRALNEPPREFMYLSYQQGVWDLNLGVAIRVKENPKAMMPVLRREVHALDAGVEVWSSLAMTDYTKPAFLEQYIASIFLLGLGIIALGLATMGIYGMMAYAVNQRTQEFGLRIALGAQMQDVLKLVLGQSMKLTLIGIGAGLLGAAAITRLLASFLYGVSPFDPGVFAGAALILGTVALAASLLPAIRASRVPPQVALRYE
jgi:predicted permease